MSRLPNIRTVAKRLRSRYFPERQLYFRANGEVRFISFSPRTQVLAAVLALALVGWVGVTSFNFLTRDQVLEAKNRQIEDMTEAYEELDAEMQRLHLDVKATADRLRARQDYLRRIVDQEGASTPESDVEATTESPGPGSNAEASASRPMAFFMKAFGDRRDAREEAATAIDELTAELTALDQRQAKIAGRLLALTEAEIAFAESVLTRTGLSKDHVLAHLEEQNADLGKGGPLVEIDEAALGFSGLGQDNTGQDNAGQDNAGDDQVLGLYQSRTELAALSAVFANMPVMKPVEKYYISSGFGPRRDPFRGHRAMHYGVDMAGWWNTPIMASADGVVTFAGRNGAYGILVEVAHENGFVTRYGHLKRIKVKRGQRVERGDVVGLMGSTGRSTGPHLHYEIRFADKPLNPLKFFKAADDVFKIQQHNSTGAS